MVPAYLNMLGKGMLSGKGGRGLKSLLTEAAVDGWGEASGIMGRAAMSLRLNIVWMLFCRSCGGEAMVGLLVSGGVGSGASPRVGASRSEGKAVA